MLNTTSNSSVIPVLHIQSEKQAVENLDLLLECGIKQVFVIGHEGKFRSAEKLVHIADLAHQKGFWCGINFLGYEPIEMLKQYANASIEALWYDNSFAGIDNQKTKAIYEAKNQYADHIKLFGGVAFKYCTQPKDLKEACTVAEQCMDVVVTSGNGTGIAADVQKINEMRCYLDPNTKLGIASGITAENVHEYDADYLLVSTGISKDFYTFDKEKIQNLIEKISNGHIQ